LNKIIPHDTIHKIKAKTIKLCTKTALPSANNSLLFFLDNSTTKYQEDESALSKVETNIESEGSTKIG